MQRNFLFGLLFLIFCVLPFSNWPKIVIPGIPAKLFPWRETIVFVLPLLYLCRYKIKFLKSKLAYTLLFLLVGFVFVCVLSFIVYEIPIIYLSVGALSYLSVVSMVLLFSSMNLIEFRFIYAFVGAGIAIAGMGLLFDFATGFKIHQMIADGGFRDDIGSQNTLVPRASFLFAGATTAASMICIGSVTIILLLIHRIHLDRLSMRLILLLVVAIAIGYGGSLLTFSRVAFAGIALTTLGVLFYLRKPHIYLFLVLGLGLGWLSFWLVIDDSSFDFFNIRVESLYGYGTNLEYRSDLHRNFRWQEGLRDMWGNIGLGSGVGSGNPRNRNLGLSINHYESFPLWVINESGLLGFLLMFFPYYASAFFLVRNRIPLWDKCILLYLVATLYALVFVNPGGGNFEIIAYVSLLFAGIYRFNSHRIESKFARCNMQVTFDSSGAPRFNTRFNHAKHHAQSFGHYDY